MIRICRTCQEKHGATFTFRSWRKLIQHALLHLIGMADELCDVRKTNLLLFDAVVETNNEINRLTNALKDISVTHDTTPNFVLRNKANAALNYEKID